MSFFEFSAESIAGIEKPLWPAKDVVEFVILDFKEMVPSNDLILSCRVLSKEHNDRKYEHYISNRDNDITQKSRIEFALAFWSKEELIAGDAKPAKLINRRFSVVASPAKEHNGKTYQGFYGWKDLGEFVPGQAASPAADAEGNPKF